MHGVTYKYGASATAGISRRLCALFAICLLTLGASGFCAWAQTVQPTGPVPPTKLDQLIKLLDDPDVRRLLAARSENGPGAVATSLSASSSTLWLTDVQVRLRALSDVLPLVPGELVRATIAANFDRPALVALDFVVLMALGLAAELGFATLIRHLHVTGGVAFKPGQHSGLATFGRSFFAEISPVVVFGLVTLGLIVLLDGTLIPSQIQTAILLALLAIRTIRRVAGVLLMPDADGVTQGQARLLVMEDLSARFWFRRVLSVSSVFFAGWAADAIMEMLAVVEPVRAVVLDAVRVMLLAVGIEIVWRRPRGTHRHHWHGIVEWMLTFWLLVLWAAFAAELRFASFLILYLVLLPSMLKIASSVIRTAFQHPESDQPPRSPVLRVLVERGARATIIAVAVLLPALAMQMDAAEMAGDTETGKIIRGILAGVSILISADIIWEIAKALINHKLDIDTAANGSDADLAQSDRLLTLLPILRNFLAVLIAIVAILMALSAIGIAVGPLMAGAGIFGVAIGFGSQTLVKDVISGIFYMTDDAFRVGEYIQSGTYKGTVESFSLRSVRLRHHRGPIFTVPFGTLGAVENMSRDWVIDKFLISVSYGTDVAAVKKLLKGIGAEILEDPELGPLIIETVKMKGVEQFGDYGINLSFSMTIKPGQQSMVRRRALVMIREAFATGGIEFASPMVQVGQDGRMTDKINSPPRNNPPNGEIPS